MTTLQTIVAAALWVSVLGLLSLVLVLYRAVDRAYQRGEDHHQGGLLPGADAPPVEILTGHGIDFLAPPSRDRPYLLGFISSDCDDCRRLLGTLAETDVWEGPSVLVLVSGGTFDADVPEDRPIEIHPAAHPPDLQRGYGITSLPLVYVMRGETVLGVALASAPEEVAELIGEAHDVAARLDAAEAETPLFEVVPRGPQPA
jgi:hypothetical protein